MGMPWRRRGALIPKSKQRTGTLAKRLGEKMRTAQNWNAQRLEPEQLQKRTDDGGDNMSNDFDDSLIAEVSIVVLKSVDNRFLVKKC